MSKWQKAGDGCSCWVNPNPYTHYGIVEPGDALEPNPRCKKHFPRWQVACINWGVPEARHAVTYCLVDGQAYAVRFHDTWADAVTWLDRHGDVLTMWADRLAENARDEAIA